MAAVGSPVSLGHEGFMTHMRDETDGMRQTLEVDGNRLTLIPDGPARLDALKALIASARRRLDLYFYIFGRDDCAVEVRDALIDACNRGVAVTLLVDAFGSSTTPDAVFAPLIEAGARFDRFGKPRSTRYLIRNHQKMVMADGKRAMIGGFNIEQGYFSAEDDPEAWRDVALRIEGPLVAPLCVWFDGLAAWTLRRRQSFRALRRMVRDWEPGEGAAIWLVGGPTRYLNCWARYVKRDLQRGHRLDMAAAYFSPGWAMVRRLCGISRRGTARIVTPSRSDNKATIGAARHIYRKLLRAGVELFEYLPQKLHSKLVVIDDIGYVGSANFDMRSLFINVELVLRVEDEAFAAALRREIDHVASESQRIDRPTFRAMARPLSRLRWWFDYLLVGVLDFTVTRRLALRWDPRGK